MNSQGEVGQDQCRHLDPKPAPKQAATHPQPAETSRVTAPSHQVQQQVADADRHCHISAPSGPLTLTRRSICAFAARRFNPGPANSRLREHPRGQPLNPIPPQAFRPRAVRGMLKPETRHTPVVHVTVIVLLVALAFMALVLSTVVSAVGRRRPRPGAGHDPRPNLPGPGIDPSTGLPWGFGPHMNPRPTDTAFSDNGVPTWTRTGPDHDPHSGGHDPHRRWSGADNDASWGNQHGSGSSSSEGSGSYSDNSSSWSDSGSSSSDGGSSSFSSGSD